MQCTDCKAAKETNGLWKRYNTPKCIHCTAQLIQVIGKLTIPKNEASARMRAVLLDAVAFGHSEAEIRKLAKAKAMPLSQDGK